ncbi:MAG: hypothetical protein ABRQ37_15185 [Candidatus Eremiobacterota bacterium]
MMPGMELVRKIDMLQPELKEVLYTFIEEIEKTHIKSVNTDAITEIKIALNDLQSLVKELSEAQKETEERLQKLIKEYEYTKKQLKCTDMTFIERESCSYLPSLKKPGYLYGKFPGSSGLCQV